MHVARQGGDLDDRHEVAVAAHLRALGHDVTCSHEVSPELREYERTVTTVVNAYLRPVCRSYLQGLAGMAPAVSVMTSAGGLVDVAFAADQIALAVAEIGSIAQRRVALMVDPTLNYNLPPFLTPAPGLNSGLMIAEVTTAALMSENKHLATPCSTAPPPRGAGLPS